MLRGGREKRWLRAAELALVLKAYGGEGGQMPRAMADAAARALSRAESEEMEVYRLEFVEGMDVRMACSRSYQSKSSYYRVRGRLLRRVVEELKA